MTETITLTCMRTEALAAATKAAIVDLCVAAHQEEDFRNLFDYVPLGGLHFLAYRAEQLVSHALVTTRWLQPEGQPVMRTAYVDAVATLPACQGRSHGSTLLRYLAGVIDQDYTVACLETDRPSFYQRLGWELWRGPLAGRSEQGLVPTPEQHGVMILRLAQTPPLDLDVTLTIECQEGRIW